jgi:serine/threonine protein kinase
LGRCTQLQKLMLAGNRLQSLPQTMADCQALELLRISANRLTALPSWLLTLPRLSWLAYGGNPFSEAFEAVATTATAHSAPAVPWQNLTLQKQLGAGASGTIHQALWHDNDNGNPAQVAVKLFKGAVTSDGWPDSELAASLAVGAHTHLIPVQGVLTGHPSGRTGLVMDCIPPHFTTLAGPPSLASCTRDVYAAGTRFALPALLRIVLGAASAAQHLHAQGLLHGDLYGHNLQCTAEGHCVLGDMGAASFLPPHDAATAQALQRLEVRALGCLLEELLGQLLAHGDSHENDALAALHTLCAQCLQSNVAARPLVGQVTRVLVGKMHALLKP